MSNKINDLRILLLSSDTWSVVKIHEVYIIIETVSIRIFRTGNNRK